MLSSPQGSAQLKSFVLVFSTKPMQGLSERAGASEMPLNQHNKATGVIEAYITAVARHDMPDNGILCLRMLGTPVLLADVNGQVFALRNLCSHAHGSFERGRLRGWMDDRPSYLPPIKLGTAMKGATIGVVAASKASGIAEGQWV